MDDGKDVVYESVEDDKLINILTIGECRGLRVTEISDLLSNDLKRLEMKKSNVKNHCLNSGSKKKKKKSITPVKKAYIVNDDEECERGEEIKNVAYSSLLSGIEEEVEMIRNKTDEGEKMDGIDFKLSYENGDKTSITKSVIEVGSCIFNLRRRLKQGYAMSPWLFDIFFYTMVRQENEGIMGRGVRLEEVSNSIKYYMQRMQY